MCTDFSEKNRCTCVLGIAFSEKYGRKKTDTLLGAMQGERSSVHLAPLRWVLAGLGMEVRRFKRLGQRSPWL